MERVSWFNDFTAMARHFLTQFSGIRWAARRANEYDYQAYEFQYFFVQDVQEDMDRLLATFREPNPIRYMIHCIRFLLRSKRPASL